MKRLIALCLAIICVFGLIGCDNVTKAEDTNPTSSLQSTESSQMSETEITDNVSGDQAEAGIEIKTKYYSITLPIDWEAYYTHEVTEDMHISLYEAKSHDASFGGWLLSIELFQTKEEYEFLPSYKLLGRIATDSGEYDVIAIYPTDVQFSEENAEQYLRMSNQIEDILKTIKLKENATFISE